MSSHLSQSDKQEFRELFDSIDTDGGGHIDLDELSEMMELLGRPMSREKLQQMMSEVDTDGGGSIDFEEFCQLVENQSAKEAKLTPLEEAEKAFKLFDADGSGTIDASELGKALQAMGQTVSDEEVREMLAHADDDGTGEIDFEEYCRLIGLAPEVDNRAPTPAQQNTDGQPKTEVSDPHDVLSSDEIKEFTEVFSLFDEDGSGEITMDELGKMMEALGRTMTEDQLKGMVATVDTDGTGSIDIQEFLILMARDKASQDPLAEAKKIFGLFDKDGSGTIDAGELGDALRAMGQQIADDEAAEMLKSADDDGTGEIDFEEFCQLMGLGAHAPARTPSQKAEKKRKAKEKKPAPEEDKEQRKSRKQMERERARQEAEQRKADEARIEKENQSEWAEFLKRKAPRPGQKEEELVVINTMSTFNYDYLLHRAAEEGDLPKVKEFCIGKGTNKLDPDEADDMGWTPLIWAVSKGQLAVLMFLLQHGVKVKKADFDGRHALHHATMGGEEKMVQLLLTANADANKTDKFGDAPLHWAAKRGYAKVAQALVNGKAEVSIKARHNETPLHWAAKRGQTEVCELLVNSKASVRAMDDAKTRPLDWARKQELKDLLDPKKREPPPASKEAEPVRRGRGRRGGQEAASSKFKQGLSSLKQTSTLKKSGSVKRKQSTSDVSVIPQAESSASVLNGESEDEGGQAKDEEEKEIAQGEVQDEEYREAADAASEGSANADEASEGNADDQEGQEEKETTAGVRQVEGAHEAEGGLNVNTQMDDENPDQGQDGHTSGMSLQESFVQSLQPETDAVDKDSGDAEAVG